MSQGHLVVPESEEVLNTRTHARIHTQKYVKVTQEPTTLSKLEKFEHKNSIVLDYKLKYKINIHEFTLT